MCEGETKYVCEREKESVCVRESVCGRESECKRVCVLVRGA